MTSCFGDQKLLFESEQESSAALRYRWQAPVHSIVLLRTKQPVKIEIHRRLINVPVIDQLNSCCPHDILIVSPMLDRPPPSPSPPSACAAFSQMTSSSSRSWKFLLLYVSTFWRMRIIEILHLISKVSHPRFGQPARIYSRLTQEFCSQLPGKKKKMFSSASLACSSDIH